MFHDIEQYLKSIELSKVLNFGLPEVDDRYHFWRVPLLIQGKTVIGEVVIDAFSRRDLSLLTTWRGRLLPEREQWEKQPAKQADALFSLKSIRSMSKS